MKRKVIKSVLAMLLVTVLAASLGLQAFACGGYNYNCPQTARYTVYYREYGSNIQLAPPSVKSAVVGRTVTETAIPINGYEVYGQSVKSLYIRSGCYNIITFYYQKQTTDYTVRYLELGTETELAPEKHVEDQPVGRVVTETAIEISGYQLVGDDTQTLELKACTQYSGGYGNGWPYYPGYGWSYCCPCYPTYPTPCPGGNTEPCNIITFYYSPVPAVTDYTVKYLDIATNEPVAPEKTVANQAIGATVTEYAIQVPGYTALDPTEAGLTLAESGNEIIFYYEAQPILTSYTIHYVDEDTDLEIRPSKTVTGVPVGRVITEYAITIPEYDALNNEITFTLTESGNDYTFYYRPSGNGD